jgi:hypothetical protein
MLAVWPLNQKAPKFVGGYLQLGGFCAVDDGEMNEAITTIHHRHHPLVRCSFAILKEDPKLTTYFSWTYRTYPCSTGFFILSNEQKRKK